MQDMSGMMGGGTMSGLGAQPRVYMRKMGGGYVEIEGISHFEKIEDGSAHGQIEFGMAEEQRDEAKNILFDSTDKYVDVKMEFDFGMVMSFSGFIEEGSRDILTITVSTEMSTGVSEELQSLQSLQ